MKEQSLWLVCKKGFCFSLSCIKVCLDLSNKGASNHYQVSCTWNNTPVPTSSRWTTSLGSITTFEVLSALEVGAPSRFWPGRLRARPQPSVKDSFPLIACEFLQKRGQRGALAADCTPTLKSASKKHQKTVHPRIWAPRVALWRWEKNCVSVCVLSPLGKNILQSLVRNLKARASNQRVSRQFAKGSNPFSDILSAI